MARPFQTIEYIAKTQPEAVAVALNILNASQWVEVTPLPDDEWAVTTKPENRRLLPLHRPVRLIAPCVGCR